MSFTSWLFTFQILSIYSCINFTWVTHKLWVIIQNHLLFHKSHKWSLKRDSNANKIIWPRPPSGEMDQADAELRQTICKVFYILCHFNIIYQSSIYRNYHYQNQVIILIIISSALFCKISRCGLMREEIKWIFWSLPKMVSIGQSLSVVKRCCAPKIFLFFS